MGRVPEQLRWVLWDLAVDELETERHADSIIARVLEYGRLSDVRALLSIYEPERILRFFRESAHPLVTERTRQFWRAFFRAEDETWPTPPSWRTSSAAPWID